jgi:hypothetical protein
MSDWDACWGQRWFGTPAFCAPEWRTQSSIELSVNGYAVTSSLLGCSGPTGSRRNATDVASADGHHLDKSMIAEQHDRVQPAQVVEPVIRVVMGWASGRRSFIDGAIAGNCSGSTFPVCIGESPQPGGL